MTLTVEQFQQALPAKVKKSVNQELIDQVNAVLSEPELYENYRENLVSYTNVMADGKFKIESYIHAVKYVTHKLLGCSNIDAWTKTFPDKYTDMIAAGVSAKDIASYVSAYNKGKLVNKIFEQTLVPSWVLNQDIYQKAINKQAELMMTANSEKVRSDAANSLLTHLKPPEVQKVELNVGVKEDSAIAALRATTLALSEQQRAWIAAGGMTAQEVAHSKLVLDQDMAEVKP